MTITILPIDADTTTLLPSYPALNERQAFAAMDSNPMGSVFGGRSGFRVGTLPSIVSVTSTLWTLNPCSARLFPAGVTYQGGYGWATDVAVTGAVTAADPSNPRLDILYITVNDMSAGDGSGARNAPVNYLAGTAAGTPVAPAVPPRSFLVATIAVPKATTGSPTITLNTARYVAAGAKLPISLLSERTALTPYLGMEIQRLDLTQVSPSGVKEVWNGTTWDHFGHSEWTFAATGIPSATVWGVGTLTAASSVTTDAAFVTTPGTDRLTLRDAGVYEIHIIGRWGTGTTGRGFSQIWDGGTNTWARSSAAIGEDTLSVSIPNFRCAANTTISLVTYLTISGTTTWTGTVRVTRVA
jgi:hypothetical protein